MPRTDYKGKRSPRWAFLEGQDVSKDGDPYLDRLRLFSCPLFGIYLHHIHRPDADPDPHDHPWWFLSFVLTGGYEEDVWPDKADAQYWRTRVRKRWSLRGLSRKSAHTITNIDGPLWTLVLCGPRKADWGFWAPNAPTAFRQSAHLVPWREYTNDKGLL